MTCCLCGACLVRDLSKRVADLDRTRICLSTWFIDKGVTGREVLPSYSKRTLLAWTFVVLTKVWSLQLAILLLAILLLAKSTFGLGKAAIKWTAILSKHCLACLPEVASKKNSQGMRGSLSSSVI